MLDDEKTPEAAASGTDDLRSALEGAFAAAETPPAEAPAQDSGPSRDERGRFASKDTTAEAAPDEAAPAVEETTDRAKEATGTEPAPPAIDPPASWSAAAKAAFAKAPPEVQHEVLKREADVAKGFEQKAAETRALAPVAEVLAQYRAKFAAYGVTEAQAVRQLLDAQNALETNPVEAIQWLARSYGVDLSRLQTQNPNQYQSAPAIDPNAIAAQARDAALRAVQEQQTLSVIEAFKADPKNVHFEEVKGHMAALLQAGVAKDLSDAYDQAVYARPDIRQRILDDQRKADEARRIEEARERAAKAKAAGASVKGAPTGGMAPVPAVSVREELLRNWGS